MVNRSTELELRLIAKDEMSKAFQSAQKEASGFGSALSGIAKTAAGVAIGGGILGMVEKLPGMFTSVIGKASDMAESLSKIDAVFGKNSSAIKDFASSAATNLGLSKAAALEATGTFGALFKAMELGPDTTKDMSEGVVKLAADLASFNNLNIDDVLIKLKAGLVGEAEPLRSLGVNLNAATIQAKAAQMGFKKVNGEFTAGAKAQAAYALILEQTKTAQGDFARTADGLANRQRIIAAQFENLQTDIGEAFLPIMLELSRILLDDVIPVINDLAAKYMPKIKQAVEDIKPTIQEMADEWLPRFQEGWETIKAALDEVLPVVQEAVTAFLDFIEPFASLQDILTVVAAALLAFVAPWAAITAAIVLLAPKIEELAQKFPILGQAFEALKTVFETGAEAIGAAWDWVQQAIQDFIDWANEYLVPVFDTWKGLFEEFAAYLQETFSPYWDALKTVIETAITYISDLFTEHWPEIQQTLEAAWEAMSAAVKTAIDLIQNTIEVLLDLLAGDWDKAWEDAKDLVTTAWDDMKDAVQKGIDAIDQLMGTIGNIITDALGDMGNLLYDVGREIMEGLERGMKDKFNDIKNWASNAAKDLAGYFKNPLKIFSPSKVFYGIGENVIEGLQRGMDNAWSDVQPMIGGMAGQLGGGFANAAPMPGKGGGNIYITVQGSILSERDVTRVVRDGIQAGGFRGIWSGGLP